MQSSPDSSPPGTTPLRVIIFGATGMIGQGLLRECIADPEITAVLSVGRNPCGVQDDKLEELVRADLFDYSAVEDSLSGYDACFFCLGVSAAGMSEADYTRVTHDLAMAAAATLVRVSPKLTFIFVSGAGTDSTESGRVMWARVKGKAENALLRLPFKASYMFRPAYIQPLNGIKSRTTAYRILYAILGPLYPVLRALFPSHVTTTEIVARAMIRAARDGYAKPILECRDINMLGA